MLNERTILRGGYGLYFLNVTGTTTQNGFSIQTPLITSNDGDRTSTFPLANPFSQGITPAPGAAQGLETFLGRGPSFSNLDYLNPYVHQFSLGVQRQLPWRTSVEISYVGSRTKQEQNSWGGFNEPSLALRDRCDVTKGGSAAFCNELLPNPFVGVAGFEGTNRFTSQTLSRFELSRPFPQFTGFSEFERNDGQIWYNSLQVTANKRMSDGISLAGTWTLAKMIEENGFRDDLAQILQKSPYTHRPAPPRHDLRRLQPALRPRPEIHERRRVRSSKRWRAAGKSPACGCSTPAGHGICRATCST